MASQFRRSMRHMEKIESILRNCGQPGLLFRNQSPFISSLLNMEFPDDELLAGCIGKMYIPPPDPEYDSAFLILVTDRRILAYISNLIGDDGSPGIAGSVPLDSIAEIYAYDTSNSSREIRIRLKRDKGVVRYKPVISPINDMMNEITRLNRNVRTYRVPVPVSEAFPREDLKHKIWRLWWKTRRVFDGFITVRDISTARGLIGLAGVIITFAAVGSCLILQ